MIVCSQPSLLQIASLKYLFIIEGGIHNAYLNDPTKEKIFFYVGHKWKYDQGKVVIIVRALYGLKYSALSWRNHIYDILVNHLGFQSYLANPSFWFEAATYKIFNEYYTYIIVYVDDLLIVEKDSQKYMAMLQSKNTVTPSRIGEPKVYLLYYVGKVIYSDIYYSWEVRSDSYIIEAINIVQKRFKEDGL